MRVAVLDLGTNVFNLLIAEFSKDGCKYLLEFKCAAKLGVGGLSKGYISPLAFETAKQALDKIMSKIKEYGNVDIIIPYATSAVRDANNKDEFVNCMNNSFGINIKVIDGIREAELIFSGIMESLKGALDINNRKLLDDRGYFANDKKALMLDIGGGSNEFIITDGVNCLYKRSFPLGMARMREKFNYKEPLSNTIKQDFINYCNSLLPELWQEIDKYKPKIFIGSSGSFDTFKDLLYNCAFKEYPCIHLSQDKLKDLNDILEKSTSDERILMPGMSHIRVDYIVLASVFSQMVIEKIQPELIYQSSYSLKEGGMRELFLKWEKENINSLA